MQQGCSDHTLVLPADQIVLGIAQTLGKGYFVVLTRKRHQALEEGNSDTLAVLFPSPFSSGKNILQRHSTSWGSRRLERRQRQLCWSPHGTAQELAQDGTIVTPGTRVRDVVLNDGTPVVHAGEVVTGAPALTIATIDFLAQGGDQYPFRGVAFTSLGVSYQQALVTYVQQQLGGRVTASQYPEGGEGRIRRNEAAQSVTHTCF